MRKLKIDHNNMICNLSKYRLVREVYEATRDHATVREVKELKKKIEESKKVFYQLFDESIRKQFDKLEKNVNKAYLKFAKYHQPMIITRDYIKWAEGFDGDRVIPTPGNSYIGVYKLKRDEDKYYPGDKEEFEPKHYKKELEMIEQFEKEFNALAKALFLQEEFVGFAIQIALKDEKDSDIALELAEFIGYLNKGQKEEVKGYIKK